MPVYSSHLVDYRGLGVGKRIREERQRKGFTLKQVAEQVNVSEAKLSNIETGKVSLDVSELFMVARVLGVSLPVLFPATTMQHYFIRRGVELGTETPVARDLIGAEPGPKKHHNPVWPLAEQFVGKHMEPVLAQVHPLADKDVHFIAHDHEEFMFVLKGQVETQIKTNDGVASERLEAGDCVYFRSNLAHCHRSTGSEPAETLNVIYSLRAIDPHDGELGASGRRYYRRGVYQDAAREASEKIGLLRRAHGLTLAELASSVGVGVRQIAQIETGDKAPDIDLLLSVARRFRQPIEYFFSTTLDKLPHYFVQRGRDIANVSVRYRRAAKPESTGSANMFRALASGFPDKGIYPYYVQVVSSPDEPLPHEHAGQSFIYVLQGQLELITLIGEPTSELLHPGDSLFLDSSLPHILRGHSRNPYAATSAEFLDVFWTPLGESYLFRD